MGSESSSGAGGGVWTSGNLEIWELDIVRTYREPIVRTYREPQDMSEIYAHPLPRVYAIFLFGMESSTSGYMGAKYGQEFGPICFDMSSASGHMGAEYFQELGPRFLTCPLSLQGLGHFHKAIPSRNK